jgi:hypothetical protein
MGVTEFLLVAGAVVVGVLATAVYGMLALPHGYFRAARACAWVGALVFVALGMLWAVETNSMFLIRALVVGVIAAGAAIGLTEALRQIKHLAHQSETKGDSKKSSLDGTIKMECGSEIFKFPPNGKMRELVVHSTEDLPAAFQDHWMSEYAYQTKPEIVPTRGGMIEKCRVTNFGSAPVFNIKIAVRIVFAEHIPRGEIMVEQRNVAEKTFVFMIPQVDAGPNDAVDFYAWNLTKFTAMVMLPREVELQRLGSNDRETVQLIPALGMMALYPAEQKPAVDMEKAPADKSLTQTTSRASPTKVQRDPEASKSAGQREPVATARLIYVRSSGALSLIMQNNISDVIIEYDQTSMYVSIFKRFIVKFIFENPLGPFDIAVDNVSNSPMLHRIEHSMKENEARFVSMAIDPLPPTAVVWMEQKSVELKVSFYKKN